MTTRIEEVLSFLKDTSNEPIASWIQTIVVVLGVFIALGQLSQVSEQISVARNEKYLEFLNRYDSKIKNAEEVIWEAYRTTTIKAFEPKNPIDTDSVSEALDAINGFVREISTCAEVNICPSSSVDSFVCKQTESMYYAIEKIHGTVYWKGKPANSAITNHYRNRHCGWFSKLLYLTRDI